MKKPVCCGYAAAFHFRAALPGMLSPTLIRDEVLERGQPCEKRLLTTTRVMKPFHGKEFPLYGVVRLVSQGAGSWHPGVFAHRIPAGFLLVKPALHPRAIGCASRGGDVLDKVAQPLPQRKHTQALALSRPVQQGVELCAQDLTDRRRDRREFLWEFEERVAQAGAETRARKQRPQTLGGAVEAIGG